MKITTKGRAAVRILVDLARNKEEYISVSEMSQRQRITPKYLERIISPLVKANLVLSMRGVNGGYKLAKAPSEITIKEILDATGDSIKLSSCVNGEKCPVAGNCDSIVVWKGLNDLINDFLENITLEKLIIKTYGDKKTR
jgi:Rrf2 family protein